jgi:hypothetical protein
MFGFKDGGQVIIPVYSHFNHENCQISNPQSDATLNAFGEFLNDF